MFGVLTKVMVNVSNYADENKGLKGLEIAYLARNPSQMQNINRDHSPWAIWDMTRQMHQFIKRHEEV